MARFAPAFSAPSDLKDSRYVVLSEQGLLGVNAASWEPLDQNSWRFCGMVPSEQHFIGYFDGKPTFALKVDGEARLPLAFSWTNLRSLLAEASIDEAAFCAVSCAMQVFHWDRDHQFCGRCSAATIPHQEERARICEACGIHYYPRLSPCVIVLVSRGEECLLAMHNQARSRFFSPLAGFIEAGESVEGALHREVAEEVALEIGDFRYVGSQPWPFPGQLMLGFHAHYKSGEIQVDGIEIAEARWFHYRDLPRVPPAGTLSGRLIRGFVEQFGDHP